MAKFIIPLVVEGQPSLERAVEILKHKRIVLPYGNRMLKDIKWNHCTIGASNYVNAIAFVEVDDLCKINSYQMKLMKASKDWLKENC
jgi:hypothetical protein